MKLKRVKLAPVLIAVGVIALTCLLRLLSSLEPAEAPLPAGRKAHLNVFEHLERITYDLRAQLAQRFPGPVATNFGFVFMSDDSIAAINNGSLDFHYGLYWPRHLYGRAYRELAAQGAGAVGFDILFREERIDHSPVNVPLARSPEATNFIARLHPDLPLTTFEKGNETFALMESDDFLAWQLQRGGTAILAAEQNVLPLDLFATNALAVADIKADRDGDGVLRHARAFSTFRKWHPAFQQAQTEGYVDLSRVRIEPGQIVLLRPDENIRVPIDAQTNFDLTGFGGEKLPAGVPRKARAFTDERVWHLGIVLAARALHANLDDAEVDLTHGTITLRGANGVQRVIPVDARGYFFINWELTAEDPRLTREPIESLLELDQIRTGQREGNLTNRWANKFVVVGSSASGNDLTDRGATALESDALLASEHWNIANSVLSDRFVRRSSLGIDLLLIVVLGVAAAWLTWQLRALVSVCAIVTLILGYTALSVVVYVQHRYWLPLVLPLSGALVMQYVCLNAWRVVFEQAEQRRVKSIFSTVVSPKIMTELLKSEKLSLGGARREVTVLFADVRGFTEFTDTSQEKASAHVADRKLTGAAAEAYYDEQARETLATVNRYLGVVAETIIQHDATLDKFIGDCVMAFWGAPVPNPNHAVTCVRAAIAAQRAIDQLNQDRAAENQRRETENPSRVTAGLEPLPPQPLLLLGSGINSGVVTVGMMGSERKAGVGQGSYTVFGREVNLASRLEGLSGRGRIFISEATYKILSRHDPALAATCVAQPPAKVKGFSAAVNIYEVPWQPPGTASAPGTDTGPLPRPA